jgi:histidinol-phosphatase
MSAQGELRRLAAFGQELLDETDRIAMRWFRSELDIRAKADATLVTQADTEIERLLRERITAAHPDHGLLGEEYGVDSPDAGWRWVIDPIDATNNFIRGIGVFATLVGVARGDEVVIGLVSAPAMRARWWAVSGEGAHLHDASGQRRIRVSDIARLADAQLCYGSLRGLDRAGLGEGVLAASRGAWRDRGFGDFWAHMLVAQGSAEAMVEVGVKPWDMAAPHAIVAEAGGRMTDLDGAPSWTAPNVLTTNGAVHDELLEVLRQRSLTG